LLFLVALFAAAVGFVQVTTFRRFELLKFLEQQEIKDARREVYQSKDQPGGPEWWLKNDKAERAASIVASSFNVVGYLARGLNGRFFARHWWFTICWSYEALQGYINYREKNAPGLFAGYTRIYKAAKHYDRRPSLSKADPNSNTQPEQFKLGHDR
jgi:hypothetical protein